MCPNCDKLEKVSTRKTIWSARMAEITKKNAVFLAALLTICIIMACSAISVRSFSFDDTAYDKESVSSVESSAISDIIVGAGRGTVNEDIRLSQQVTVTTDEGTIPVSGKIVKSKDEFYPETYELSFSKNAILSSEATIEVKMASAKAGDRVYVLIGNKNNGYREYATVDVQADGKVAFSTNIIQNYTLSTTNIKGAQEAMADLLSSRLY